MAQDPQDQVFSTKLIYLLKGAKGKDKEQRQKT